MKKSKIIDIITLGETSVGKTSIINRLVGDQFNPIGIATIGIDSFRKTYSKSEKSYDVNIWDSAGQERFHSISENYINRAEGIFLVFDITNKESFEKIQTWQQRIEEKKRSDSISILLIGNKKDLNYKRKVTNKEAKDYAKKYEMIYSETSAKTGENIENIFDDLVEMIIEARNKTLELNLNENENDTVNLKNQEKTNKDDSCCLIRKK